MDIKVHFNQCETRNFIVYYKIHLRFVGGIIVVDFYVLVEEQGKHLLFRKSL